MKRERLLLGNLPNARGNDGVADVMTANRCVIHNFLNPILDCVSFAHKTRRSRVCNDDPCFDSQQQSSSFFVASHLASEVLSAAHAVLPRIRPWRFIRPRCGWYGWDIRQTGNQFLPIRPINFQLPEFQAVRREQYPTPAVAGCPPVILPRVSDGAGCPRQRHS